MGILTQDEYITKLKSRYGDVYDYSFVDYKTSQSMITLTCNKCGAIHTHRACCLLKNKVYNNGCKSCDANVFREQHKADFIDKATAKFGDRFDYSLVNYVNSKVNVDIICRDHGIIKTTVYRHLNGSIGCVKCKAHYVGRCNATDTTHFIKKATSVHGDKYDYSKVDYYSAKTNVVIICKKHGEFKQQPTHHYDGRGCPVCTVSNGEYEIECWLTDNNIKYNKQQTFDGCRNKSKLRFDFYLQEHNKAIEYDGIVHFVPYKFYGGIEGLEYNQLRDSIKTAYCKSNNIPLLRIKYTEFESIPNLLKEFVNV